MEFNSSVITEKGQALISEALAGNTNIVFTRIVTGDGEHEESADLSKLMELGNEKQTFPLSAKEILNERTVHLKYIVSNVNEDGSALTEGYFIRELGLYAKADKDGAEELLYAVVTAKEGKADYLPPYNELQPSTITMDWYVEVANAAAVTIQGGSGAYALADDVNDLMQRFLKLENEIKSGTVTIQSEDSNGKQLVTSSGSQIVFAKKVAV